MSGGSLGYLYRQSPWHPSKEEIRQVKYYLLERGHKKTQAYKKTRKLLKRIDQAAELFTLLEGVFRAVEWNLSADWGEDQVAEVIQKLEQEAQ